MILSSKYLNESIQNFVLFKNDYLQNLTCVFQFVFLHFLQKFLLIFVKLFYKLMLLSPASFLILLILLTLKL